MIRRTSRCHGSGNGGKAERGEDGAPLRHFLGAGQSRRRLPVHNLCPRRAAVKARQHVPEDSAGCRSTTLRPADRRVVREPAGMPVDGVSRKLENLGEALENNGATPWVLGRIRDREAELDRLDRELSLEPAHLEEKLVVLPSWVQRQLADVAGLLHDEPERVRAHFRRIGLSHSVSPVLDAPRPFLRAVGTADVMQATFGREFDFSATGRSLPRSAPGSRLPGRSRPLY